MISIPEFLTIFVDTFYLSSFILFIKFKNKVVILYIKFKNKDMI